MKSTGVNTSLSISISFLLGTYLSSGSFAIAQWTLITAWGGTMHSKWTQRHWDRWTVRTGSSRTNNISGLGTGWVSEWLSSVFHVPLVLGIQIFIPYLCAGNKAPMMYLSKSVHPYRMLGTSLLHERISSTHLSLNSSVLPQTPRAFISGPFTWQWLTGSFVTGPQFNFYLSTIWFEDKGTRIF